MSDAIFEDTATQYEQAAAELERAAAHLRVTAQHFRERDVPRGCAHAFAATGHLANAEVTIRAMAQRHASRAQLPTPPTQPE